MPLPRLVRANTPADIFEKQVIKRGADALILQRSESGNHIGPV